MATGTKKKTYADYEKLPEGAPYQLINGMLVESPSPTPLHQRIIIRLTKTLLPLQEKGIGEVLLAPIDVYLSETETYQPDIIFISTNRLDIIGEKKIEGPPDVVVEILSPGTAYYDLRHKMKVYETSGVREYWIIDPMEKTIELYENGEAGFTCITRAGKSARKTSQENTKGVRREVRSKLFPDFVVDPDVVFGF